MISTTPSGLTAITDSLGQFLIFVPALERKSQSFTLTANKAGYEPAVTQVTLHSNRPSEQVVVLVNRDARFHADTLLIAVRAGDGNALPGVEIEIAGVDGRIAARATSDQGGLASVLVPSGFYIVRVVAADNPRFLRGGTVGVTFDATKGLTVTLILGVFDVMTFTQRAAGGMGSVAQFEVRVRNDSESTLTDVVVDDWLSNAFAAPLDDESIIVNRELFPGAEALLSSGDRRFSVRLGNLSTTPGWVTAYTLSATVASNGTPCHQVRGTAFHPLGIVGQGDDACAVAGAIPGD